MEKNFTVCFTGHRPKSLPWGYDETKQSCFKFKEILVKTIANQIENGATTFLTGMAEGFDMISAEMVIKFKDFFPQIRLIAVIPCNNQDIKWSKSQQQRYKEILTHCDDVVTISQNYTRTCMNDRNKYLIDHSDVCIACSSGKPGGTENTILLAKEKGLTIILLSPNGY